MVNEWDERKARRAYLVKIAAVFAATIVTTGFPVWLFYQVTYF